MNALKSRLVLASALAGVALVSACTATTSAAPPTPSPSAAASAAASPQALGVRSPGGGYYPKSVQLGENTTLGKVVVDGQGFTLYRFDKDTASPSVSNCVGSCVQQWPPVLASDTITFQNLDPTELGAVTRQDGTHQVTVGGWPVYRYVGDQVPGQTQGQGVGGTWFAVAPDGSKAGQSTTTP